MKLQHHPSVRRTDQYQIDPRALQVRPDFNIRDLTTEAARERLDVLKAQIKAEGVLEPLEIEFDGETPWINEGHRRHMVVMELIAEGCEFKSIPCIAQKQGTTAAKQMLHMLMRKKEEYEPLEYAKGVDRLVNVYGWDKSDLARDLGFKSKASIEQYLEMLRMDDKVKEQVTNGEVSATTALKVTRDMRDARTDPEFAAEIIRDAADEQKRLGKRGRATPKAIQRATQRRNPKPEPKAATEAQAEQPAPLASGLPATPTTEPQATFVAEVEEQPEKTLTAEEKVEWHAAIEGAKANQAPGPSMADVQAQIEKIVTAPVHPQLQAAVEREAPVARTIAADAMLPPNATKQYDRALFAIVAKVAEIAEGFDLNEFAEGETIGCSIPAQLFKDADRLYRARTGDLVS